MKSLEELKAIVARFDVKGEIQEIKPLGNGLINDTLLVKTDGPDNYVLQRVNNAIFKDVDLVREQLPDIPADQILAEPEARNTAPCIAYACWKIAQRYPAANIVVTPADALVLKTDAFADAIRKALAVTDGTDAIVTVGITPTRPETGYGYIYAAEAVPGEVVKVSAFKEKPDAATAEAYLADGHYFWNAGIFIWNVKTITRQLRAYAPQIAGVMDTIAPALFTDAETSVLRKLFPTCEKISIDYAVMEKSRNIYVIAGDYAWSDLGSWGSIKTHIEPDAERNTVVGGDIRLFGCKPSSSPTSATSSARPRTRSPRTIPPWRRSISRWTSSRPSPKAMWSPPRCSSRPSSWRTSRTPPASSRTCRPSASSRTTSTETPTTRSSIRTITWSGHATRSPSSTRPTPRCRR